MRQKAILFLIIGIAVFTGSIIISSPDATVLSTEDEFYQWQKGYMNSIRHTVESLKKDSSSIYLCLKEPASCTMADGLNHSHEAILVYKKNDSLVYWSSARIPSPAEPDINAENILWSNKAPYIMYPIAHNAHYKIYYMSSPRNAFIEAYPNITKSSYFQFQHKPSKYPVLNEKGEALFFFYIDKFPDSQPTQWPAFLLYSLSLISLILGFYYLVKLLFTDYSKQWRVVISIVGFLLIRFITSLIFYPGFNIDIYNSSVSSAGVPDLEKLWINILLFYACLILITNRLKIEKVRVEKQWNRFLIHCLTYVAIILACILVAFVGRSVVFYSGLGHALATIGEWDIGSFISLIAFIIFMVTVFHLAWFLIRTITDVDFSLPNKILAIVVSCILSLGVYTLLPIHIPPFPFYLIVILLILLMDLFTEEKNPNLNWLFIWVAIASACSTSVLYKYYIDKIDNQQVSILYSSAYANAFQAAHHSELVDYAQIENIDYAVYVNNKRQFYHGEFYPLQYPYDTIPPLNEVAPINRKNRYEIIYRPDKEVIVVSSRVKDDIITPISWYAYVFVIWILFTALLAFLNTQWNFLPEGWNLRMTQLPSLRRRIQLNIMMITIGSFAAVCVLSFIYLKYTSSSEIVQKAMNKISILIDDIESDLNRTSVNSIYTLHSLVEGKATLHRTKVTLYDKAGKAITPGNRVGKYRISFNEWQKIHSDKQASVKIHNRKSTEVVSPIYYRGQVLAYLGLDFTRNTIDGPYNNFLTTLLKLYIFLGVIALGVSLAVANSITNPLRKLADKIKEFKLGKKNQRLEWKNPDEIGELIRDYNSMVQELEASAEILAAQERDVAWREMAKQVAHEIKNPLTPMKLSIQHLKYTIENDPERSDELIEQVSMTLIEQIDNLSRIASGFSDFAKMPTADNKKTNLNEVVSHVHNLFRKRKDMNIELNVPLTDVFVFADKDQLSRIVTNLLKNAIQAIPTRKEGNIIIELYTEENNALISIQDNGTGIPEEMKDKVFKPNFTSKSSGTGLGLAICANMVEGFNGKIYFDTVVGTGTTFYVEIPQMHDDESNRVYL